MSAEKNGQQAMRSLRHKHNHDPNNRGNSFHINEQNAQYGDQLKNGGAQENYDCTTASSRACKSKESKRSFVANNVSEAINLGLN
jgi:hypothetical protein